MICAKGDDDCQSDSSGEGSDGSANFYKPASSHGELYVEASFPGMHAKLSSAYH